MRVAVCLDKSGGMMFNSRRQSKDSVLRQRLLALAGEGGLWLNSYSAKQFETADNLNICDDFLLKAGEDDLCFVENTPVSLENADQVCLFQWNRDYPADTYFEFDPKALGFKKVSTEDFAGSSHEKITLEVYRRK